MYKTPNGHVLLFSGTPSRLTLCVEDSSKWSALYCVYPSKAVERIEFDSLGVDSMVDSQPSCFEKVPNPMDVCSYAAKHKMDICSKSLAAITRRWYNRYHCYQGYYLEHDDNCNES